MRKLHRLFIFLFLTFAFIFTLINFDVLYAESIVETKDKVETINPVTSSDSYDDWMLECYTPAINGVKCQMIQKIVHEQLKQNILVMSLAFNSKQEKDIVQFILPLDFNLIPGVLIEVDNYKEVLSVNRCSTDGCYIEGGIKSDFTTEMRKSAEKGRFILVSRDDKKIAIPFSAKGFLKAYDKMLEENKK